MIHTNLPKIWQHHFFPDAPHTQCRCGNKMELKSLANMDKGAYNADIQHLYGAWLYLLLAPLLHQMHVVVHRPPVATRLPPASFPHLPLPHSLPQAGPKPDTAAGPQHPGGCSHCTATRVCMPSLALQACGTLLRSQLCLPVFCKKQSQVE